MSSSIASKKVLLIYPGPSYRLADLFSERLTELSKQYQGILITTGPSDEDREFDRFQARRVSSQEGKAMSLWRQLRLIWSETKSSRFDLVVSYDPLKSGLLGLIAAKRSGARLLVEVNGDYTNPANFHEISNEYLRFLKMFIFRSVQNFVLRRASAIKLLYSNQLSGLTIPREGKVIRVMPNRTELEKFAPVNDLPFILTTGYPWFVKGIDSTIKAFLKITDSFPEWRLKCVGWFDGEQELIRLVGENPRIELLPPVHHSQMPELLGSCGVLVQASRTEAMGRVLVEGMAAGKARIGTRVGGIPTVIEDGVDGLLVPPDNVDALAGAMSRLMGDPVLRNELGQNARARAKSQFGRDRYYSELLSFYVKVINQ